MKNRYLVYFVIAGYFLGILFGILIHNTTAGTPYFTNFEDGTIGDENYSNSWMLFRMSNNQGGVHSHITNHSYSGNRALQIGAGSNNYINFTTTTYENYSMRILANDSFGDDSGTSEFFINIYNNSDTVEPAAPYEKGMVSIRLIEVYPAHVRYDAYYYDSSNNPQIIAQNLIIDTGNYDKWYNVSVIRINNTHAQYTVNGTTVVGETKEPFNVGTGTRMRLCNWDDDGEFIIDDLSINNTGASISAPVMNSFAVDTEPGADAGWDLDNDDVQVDFNFEDDDGNPITLLFTYNNGSQARQPTTTDNDFNITSATNQTNYDLNWNNATSWSDYDGEVYVRIRAWDGTYYSNDSTPVLNVDYDILDFGIDGTAPTTNVDNIADYQITAATLAVTATATDSPADSKIDEVTLYYRFSNDNSTWGSWTQFSIDYTSPWEWTFTFPNSEGWYRLGTRGHDEAGNTEAEPPAAGDEEVFYGNIPVISDPTPANQSNITTNAPTCYVKVADPDWNLLTVSFYENTTGSWVLRDTDSNIGSGSYADFDFTQASGIGTYWWLVNVTDGIRNASATYHFNIVNLSGNVLMNCYDVTTHNNISYWSYVITGNTVGTITSGTNQNNTVNISTVDWATDDYYTFRFAATGYFDSGPYTYTHGELANVVNFTVDAYLTPTGYGAPNNTWYELRVINRFETPLENVRVEMIHVVNETDPNLQNGSVVGILYTDNYGEVQFPNLVAHDTHFVNLSKDCYLTRVERWVPDVDDHYKTFMLDLDPNCENRTYMPSDIISVEGEISNTTMFINVSDLLNETENAQVHIYELNHSTGTSTLLIRFTHVDNSSIRDTQPVNISNSHTVIIHLNHTTFGHLVYTLTFIAEYAPLTNETEFEDVATRILKWCPFGWSNFILFVGICIGFFSADRDSIGMMLIFLGGMFLFINYMVGFNTTFVTWAGGIIPPLVILGGILIIWDDSRRVVSR
jgi:hypothetical protein